MPTKARVDPVIHPGVIIQVYAKKGLEKRGKWFSPRIVQIVDSSASTVSFPASHGHNIIAAVELVRIASTEDDPTTQSIELIEKMDGGIFDALEDTIAVSESSKLPTTDNIEILADESVYGINRRSLEFDHISGTAHDVYQNSLPESVDNHIVGDIDPIVVYQSINIGDRIEED